MLTQMRDEMFILIRQKRNENGQPVTFPFCAATWRSRTAILSTRFCAWPKMIANGEHCHENLEIGPRSLAINGFTYQKQQPDPLPASSFFDGRHMRCNCAWCDSWHRWSLYWSLMDCRRKQRGGASLPERGWELVFFLNVSLSSSKKRWTMNTRSICLCHEFHDLPS